LLLEKPLLKRQKLSNAGQTPSARHSRSTASTEKVAITSKTSVGYIKHLDKLPRVWEVPDEDNDFAYLLDLRHSKYKYEKSNGSAIPMSGIIRAHDSDAWSGISSGGERNKATVLAFGDEPIRCKTGSYRCNGLYKCEFIDAGLLAGYKRHGIDENKRKSIFEAERLINSMQWSSGTHKTLT
jgi:hypothetical protein